MLMISFIDCKGNLSTNGKFSVGPRNNSFYAFDLFGASTGMHFREKYDG